MAVSGECITPAITPAIPARTKTPDDSSKDVVLVRTTYAKNPLKLPIRSEGANIPPIPPEPFVIAMAITLKNSTKTKKIITIIALSEYS